MNKFELADMIKSAKPVNKESFIADRCSGKIVLDLGCIRHSSEFVLKDADWLHKRIRAVARKVTGVDYLPEEIEKINSQGYDIIFGDVTQPLNIAEKFDAIIAGDLLEHLVNFEGFFTNCRKLLKPGGILIITTPNPFFCGEFHYVSFKKNFIVNPEHTCWIDPQCLLQLAGRFEFEITEIAFIKKSWALKNLICESNKCPYDIIKGEWSKDTFGFKLFRMISGLVFDIFYIPYKILTGTNSKLCKYSDYLAVLKIGRHE